MDPQRRAFLDAIGEDRYDQATRLVYADWLEENGLDDEALEQRSWTPRRQGAEDWLRGFVADIRGECYHEPDEPHEAYNVGRGDYPWAREYRCGEAYFTYEEAMGIAHAAADAGGEYPDDWLRTPFDTPERVYRDLGRFWEEFEVLTGKAGRGNFISCSC